MPEIVWRAYVEEAYWHRVVGPVMTGIGVGLIVMFLVTVESHPDVLCASSVMTPAGPAFHRTEIAVPVFEVIVPPVTVQVYEVLAVLGVE